MRVWAACVPVLSGLAAPKPAAHQGHGTARTAGGCDPSPRWSSSSLQVNCANQECDLM